MSKPRYTEGLMKIIFLWLGIAFVAMGLLGILGILKPTAESQVQEPVIMGIIFGVVGIAFLVAGIILKVITSSKNKRRNELLASGTRVNGMVERVYVQWYTQYGKKSPYRILYTYTYQGKVYHHKSELLWEKPDLAEGDSVVVYAGNSGKSVIQMGI